MLIKFTKYLFYVLVAYLLIGFIAVPLILKPQLIKILESETKSQVNIESLSFNPLIFQLTMEGFSLKNLDKKELFSFKSLRLNLNPTSLLYGAIELKEFALNNPRIFLVYNKNKTINLLSILKEKKEKDIKKEESETKSSLPHIIIDKIKMENGELFYTDYTRVTPFHFSLHNIGFMLKDFDTKKIERDNAGIRLYSRLGDGGFVDFKSRISSIEPLKMQGSLAFEASKLYTEWKYLSDELKLEVADGKVSFSTDYSLNLDDLNSTKIDNLNIAVEKLRIKPKAKDQDILNLDSLYVKNMVLFPMQQRGKIGAVTLHGLRVKAKRYENKEIDWINYIETKKSDLNSTKRVSKKDTKSKPWKISLASLDLEKISLQFDDEAIQPNVITHIKELDIHAQHLTLLGKNPFEYQVKIAINKKGSCLLNGSLAYNKLDLSTNVACRELDIVHYRPYIDTIAKQNLVKYDLSLDKALVDFNVAATLVDQNSSVVAKVSDANMSLKEFTLSKKSTNYRVVEFQNFSISGVMLDSAKRELYVKNVTLNTLVANLLRKKSGALNISGIVIPKKSSKKSSHKKSLKEKRTTPYRVKIDQVSVKNAKVVFVDKKISKQQKEIVDKINIDVKKIDSQKRSWLQYSASLRVNKKGTIQADGKVRHTPLKQSGVISAKKLSLVALTPYLQEKSYLSVDDGSLSFKVHESYLPSKKSPDLHMKGEIALNSLFVSNTNDSNSSLFSLDELAVKPFTLELFPNRLYIDEVSIDSFYVSAKIDENKTINFAQLMKKDNSKKSIKSSKKKVSKDTKKKKKLFPLKIVKVNVKNGSAEFQDFSLPIKFKTNIHDLNGEIYAISTRPGDTTYVDIDGAVDKYGSTKLKGSVDSFNPKEFTKMNFNFKNLDLHSMSGYSASFAGYEIDSGKLYLDLGYDILHSKLNATNNIMIKKIKLGKELEGKNIHHLPLGFVIGLLEDSDGIVDIDMPIKGDVNSPDFKYGALVWKTLGNLIAKAVTSPFKFLGSMMGLDGEELSFLTFEFGKTNITPPQREKLDKIVKMMNKRPKILLEIDGTYDAVKDAEALKLQKLVAMVMKKSGDENIRNRKTALNINMLEDLYKSLKNDDKVKKLQEKLLQKYKGEEYKRAYQNGLIKLCKDLQKVTKAELQELAKKRAEMVVSYLVNDKAILAKRVVVGDIIQESADDDKGVKLKLNIKVQSKDK